MKSSYSEDLQRRNVLSLYDPVYSDDRQHKQRDFEKFGMGGGAQTAKIISSNLSIAYFPIKG